jgi:tetratricopeptide (TPR) repeat protein
MQNVTTAITSFCLAAFLGMVTLSAPVSAEETNEQGLTAEQAVSLNEAIQAAKQSYSQRKYRDAVESYHQALQIYNQDFLTFYNIGVSYRGLKEEDSAQVYLGQAIQLNPQFGPARLALATSYLKTNNLENAEQSYVSINTDMPDSIQYVMAAEQGLLKVAKEYTNRAVRMMRQRDYDAAEGFANRAVVLAGSASRPAYVAGSVQEKKKNLDQASAFFTQAHANAVEGKDKASALVGMGRIEIARAKVAARAERAQSARSARRRAIELLREAVGIDNTSFSGYVNLGNTLFELGEYAEARDALIRAEELNARSHTVPFKLAETYMQLGQCTSAEAAASRAIALRRTNASAHNARAEALECLGRTNEAIQEYDIAARDPRWRQHANYKAKKLREKLDQ